MCAIYGASGGPHGLGLTFDLPPMHEPDSRALVERWAREQRGRARITGRKARNLNPLIHVRGGARSVELGWWWLHVAGAPAPYSAFNSRDDALLRSWREPFQRRALLPARWYVEKGRTFALPGDELFGIAAIVTPVPGERGGGIDGEGELLSYSMVTRDAVAAAAEADPRMPLVLPREFHDEWLDPDRVGDAELISRARFASEGIGAALRIIDVAGEGSMPPTLF
ncbi:SOS response-associated peptidase family protein [Leucobacter ruminantium]|uniref:SOS response-associated peptidase family protein n=1 Tax=Leucobacter ruminantium TaxID=1289170 RepID=A0A939LT23_9MICO|nr:SOS response-associated peptidase family protein [Leucobacter ruminantium]MBO1804325.1 SOS response-associated peptidase family protein [Leucobacter ruminantium]